MSKGGFKVYIDNTKKDYKEPERKSEDEILSVRLYCQSEGCKKYIKGKVGYNGGFTAETGQFCDLRNQSWFCEKHL